MCVHVLVNAVATAASRGCETPPPPRDVIVRGLSCPRWVLEADLSSAKLVIALHQSCLSNHEGCILKEKKKNVELVVRWLSGSRHLLPKVTT